MVERVVALGAHCETPVRFRPPPIETNIGQAFVSWGEPGVIVIPQSTERGRTKQRGCGFEPRMAIWTS